MVVLKVLREFAGGTSIHGFTFLVSPKSSSRTKIIWAIAIVVALSYASWEMKNSVISKYYFVFRAMKYKPLIIITYVQIHFLKSEFELVIYEKVAQSCLVINKDVRFTTIAFLQVALFTGGSRLMQISLLRFFKTFHKYLPYANFGLFISLVQFFGQNIWLM